MRDENFMHAVNEICAFLGNKEVPNHTKAAWFQKVENIPDEAVPYIVAKITDEVDAMPRNLPKVFREKFRAWQMENPDKVAVIEQQGCRDCEMGVLFLERTDDNGHKQTATIFCQCYQGSAGYVGRSTLAYMARDGWRSTKHVYNGSRVNRGDLSAQMARARRDAQNPDWNRVDRWEDEAPF